MPQPQSLAASLGALAMLLSLGGCGGGDTRNAEAITNGAANGDTIVERIQAMNEGERNVTLFRAIRDAGRDCQGVTRSVPTDPVQGRPAWIATCDNQGEWLIAIAPNGTAIVSGGRTTG
jgi:hypothetical protein